MEDVRYKSKNVAEAHRAIFDQMELEFPEYEIWERHENFDRKLSAGIVNRMTGVAVTVAVILGDRPRTQPLTDAELARIRAHLASKTEDLVL